MVDLNGTGSPNAQGPNPANFAVQQQTKCSPYHNPRATAALGLAIPSSLLELADQIIE
jgi:hypothetical protein